MLIKTGSRGFSHSVSSEITPQGIYQGRRDLIRLMATGTAGVALAGWAGRQALAQTVQRPGKLARQTIDINMNPVTPAGSYRIVIVTATGQVPIGTFTVR